MKSNTNDRPALNRLFRNAQAAALLLFWLLSTAAYCQGGPGGITSGTQLTSTGYGMVWIDAPGDSRIVSTSSLPGFVASNIAHELDGFQLIDLEVAGVGNTRRFGGIWHEASPEAEGHEDAAHLFVDLSFAELEATRLTESAAGYRMIDLEVYPRDGGVMTAAVFHPSSLGSSYSLNLSALGLANETSHQATQGRKLKDVEAYHLNGQTVYAAVWHEVGLVRSDSESTINGSWQDLLNYAALNEGAMYLADLELVPPAAGANPWSAHAVWAPGGPAQHVLVPASWDLIESTHHSFGFGELRIGGERRNMLPIDLEIFWHYRGGIESTLTVSHGGPMVPEDG